MAVKGQFSSRTCVRGIAWCSREANCLHLFLSLVKNCFGSYQSPRRNHHFFIIIEVIALNFWCPKKLTEIKGEETSVAPHAHTFSCKCILEIVKGKAMIIKPKQEHEPSSKGTQTGIEGVIV